jgi:hypothetical protein
MTHPRLTWDQLQPGFMITAKLGNVKVGAIFPGKTESWDWWFWYAPAWSTAPSEQAAKDALTARVAEWLREAGLEQVKEAPK